MGAVAEVLATEGLWLVIAGAVLAGIVRGFSGFGTAMIYLPFASAVLDPVAAVMSLVVMDTIGPLPLIPNALRVANRKHLGLLVAGLVLMLPVGLMALTRMEPEVYRTVLAVVTLIAVALMVSGWRYPGALRPGVLFGAGAAGGLMGGAAGVPGPPVILVTLASPMRPAAVRATNMVYLMACDILIWGLLWLHGQALTTPIVVGLVVLLPYMAGTQIGARIFDPERERMYRLVAYAVIGGSGVSALPIWG